MVEGSFACQLSQWAVGGKPPGVRCVGGRAGGAAPARNPWSLTAARRLSSMDFIGRKSTVPIFGVVCDCLDEGRPTRV